MKTAKGLLLLTLLLLSLFCLVVTPIEIQRTLSAQSWQPVEVEIAQSRIEAVQSHFHLHLRIRDLETGNWSSQVEVRRGDIAFNFAVFSALVGSTLYADRDRYPAGVRTSAYRSPDGRHYVLEQNSIRDMVILLAFACIYPAIAVRALVNRRRLVVDSALSRHGRSRLLT